MENTNYYIHELTTVIGKLILVGSEKGLYAALWEKVDEKTKLPKLMAQNPNYPLFQETEKQLNEYFAGKRQSFSLPLDLSYGTLFQKAAWNALREIPYGEVRTYSQQAQKIGKPKAIRAIGSANGRNLLAVIIPCHRVIASNGKLAGYAGGMDIKKYLLDLEAKYS